MPDTRTDRGFLGVAPETWARVAVLVGLFTLVFWMNLRRLWLKTNPFTGEANWSHAVVVPIIGLYYLFVHREDLMKADPREFIWGRFLRLGRVGAAAGLLVGGGLLLLVAGHRAGLVFSMMKPVAYAAMVLSILVIALDWSLAITIFGLGVFVYGISPGENDYLKDLGMIITLFGMVLLLNGPRVMKIAWFPIVFLICAIPWPGLVYSWVAEPLQGMAAWVAVNVLKVSGVEALCSGTKIIIFNQLNQPPRVLNVAEACAGMRSLMTFISVAGAFAFLSSRPLWQKLIIVASAVPIAIFCNVMRISGQGLLDHYVNPQWSESFAHQFVGMVMLLPAFFLIWGVGIVLDKLVIEEAEEGDSDYVSMPKSVSAVATHDSAIPELRAVPGSGSAAAFSNPVTRVAATPPSSMAFPSRSPDLRPAVPMATSDVVEARTSLPAQTKPITRPPGTAPRAPEIAPRTAGIAPLATEIAPRAAEIAPRAAESAQRPAEIAARAASLRTLSGSASPPETAAQRVTRTAVKAVPIQPAAIEPPGNRLSTVSPSLPTPRPLTAATPRQVVQVSPSLTGAAAPSASDGAGLKPASNSKIAPGVPAMRLPPRPGIIPPPGANRRPPAYPVPAGQKPAPTSVPSAPALPASGISVPALPASGTSVPASPRSGTSSAPRASVPVPPEPVPSRKPDPSNAGDQK